MKILPIREISQTLPFYSESGLLSLYRRGFESSDLGHIYRLFPFTEIAQTFGLKSGACGRRSFFSPEGKIALMLLKNYTSLSDKKLIEQLNGNIYYQLFCGIFIRPGHEILDSKLVSKIRCELSRRLDMDSFQKVLAGTWAPLLDNPGVAMSDATCYESHLRFPTNEKLLWESIEWIYKQIIIHCHILKIRRPRSKYGEIHKRYLSYSRSRKKTHKKRKKLRSSLIYLLGKLNHQLDGLEGKYLGDLHLWGSYHKRRNVIRQVLDQQVRMHATGKSVPHRIVSVHKHYIRPSSRGKKPKQSSLVPRPTWYRWVGLTL